MTRRAFLALLAGGAGAGAASWVLTRGTTPVSAADQSAAMTTLPPVPTTRGAAAAIPIDAGAVATTPAGPAHTVAVLCRDAWGARPIAGSLTTHTPVRLTVHHTAALLTDPTAAPSYIRDHQAFHQLEKGWSDIAYHYLIDTAGVVYEGRPYDAVGDTGTDYDPTGHLLVACEGNFERQPIEPRQLAALVDVLAWAAATLDIDPATISAHRDWASTVCPGEALYAPVADGTLEAAVRHRLTDGGVGLDHRCGESGAAIIASIEAGREVSLAPISWDDRDVE